MAGKRNVRLKTVGDVSHFLARLINEARRGEIEVALAGRLAYMANILLNSIRNDREANSGGLIIVEPPIQIRWVEPENELKEGYNDSGQ